MDGLRLCDIAMKSVEGIKAHGDEMPDIKSEREVQVFPQDRIDVGKALRENIFRFEVFYANRDSGRTRRG